MANNRDSVFASFKTIVEMFEARGKTDIVDELRMFSNDELDLLIKRNLIFSLDFTKLRVIYCLEPKLKTQDVKKFLEDETCKAEYYIVVLREKTTATNIKTLQIPDKNVQVFEIKEIQFNITKHHLVPKHRLIESNDETLNAIFQKLNIKSRAQLPVILKTDPIAKFLNGKPGDLMEIIRYSPTCGETIFYRIVA